MSHTRQVFMITLYHTQGRLYDYFLYVTHKAGFYDNSLSHTGQIFGISSPDGLAFDWISKRIFWSDLHFNRIFSMKLDKTEKRTVIVVQYPRAISLTPCQGSAAIYVFPFFFILIMYFI